MKVSRSNFIRWCYFALVCTVFVDNFFISVGFSLKPYMVLSALILLVDINQQLTRIKKLLLQDYTYIFVVSYVIYAMLSVFWSVEPIKTLKLNIALILSVFTAFVVVANFNLYYEHKKTIQRLMVFVVLLGISSHLYNAVFSSASVIRDAMLDLSAGFSRVGLANSLMSFTYVGHDFVPRFNGFSLDPNFATITVLYLLAMFTINPMSQIGKFGFIISVLFLLLAFSRSAIASLAVAFFLVNIRDLLLKNKLDKRNVILVVVFFLTVFFLSFSELFDVVIDKFESTISSGGKNIRNEYIWPSYLALFDNVIGYGWNYGYSKVGVYTHNFYLASLMALGVPGLSLVILILLRIIYNSMICKSPFPLMLAISLTIVVFSIDVQFQCAFWTLCLLLNHMSKIK